jgi:hypothetical protein
LQALLALQKAGPPAFMQRPAVLATRMALLEATADLQGAKRLAQSSLQVADAPRQGARGKASKEQAATAMAVLYEALARIQLKV